MFNLIVGTGALTMPKAFATAGWGVSIALISFLGFMRQVQISPSLKLVSNTENSCALLHLLSVSNTYHISKWLAHNRDNIDMELTFSTDICLLLYSVSILKLAQHYYLNMMFISCQDEHSFFKDNVITCKLNHVSEKLCEQENWFIIYTQTMFKSQKIQFII